MPLHETRNTDLSRSLDTARRDLLDLGLRNPLLNYKVLRARGLDIVDENPVEVFRILVHEEKRMTFAAGGSSAASGNGAQLQLGQPIDEMGPPARHSDLKLQTEYTSAQLQSRLLATYHAARSSIEEQGVNTLYLALGMLRWREEDTGETFCRAPLILIPVGLERANSLDRFHLNYTGEELGENVSLAVRLKRDFGIQLPELSDADDLDVAAYFQQVKKAAAGREGWSVETDAVALGFFSFAKFLMYRDLDHTSWPKGAGLLEHSIIQSLLGESGFGSSSSGIPIDGNLDDQIQTQTECLQVVDADSSQTIALLEAMSGHNMVIQGPPGTGKSQTIVNLIAAALGKGKKVLFVSEKMAALDVVKRRLDKAKLGGACLELHSNKTNKKTLISELKRTVYSETPAAPGFQKELALLVDFRNRLNGYCAAVNEPIGGSGDTPCSVYGKLLDADDALRGLERPPLRINGSTGWTAVDTARRTQVVQQLEDRLKSSGVPVQHPFWGTRLTTLLPGDRDDVRALAVRAAAAGADLDNAARTLAQLCSVPPPSTPTEARFLGESAKFVSGAPDLSGLNTESGEWRTHEAEIWEIVDAGKRHRDLRRRYEGVLRPDVWGRDVSGIRQVVAQLGEKWWRFLSGKWRRAKQELDSLCIGAPLPDHPSRLALLDAIAITARAAERITAAHNLMAGLFSHGHPAKASDWDLMERQAMWVINGHKGVQQGVLGSWCIGRGVRSLDRAELDCHLQRFNSAQEAFVEAVKAWTQKMQIDEMRFERPLFSQSFANLLSRWEKQSLNGNRLLELVSVNHFTAQCDADGLQAVTSIALNWEPAATHLVRLFERARLGALLDSAFQSRPPLAAFDGGSHAQTVDHFRRLDVLQFDHNAALLAERHAQSLPAGGGAGEIGVLWKEFEKRGRFLPIRNLMLKAGHAIQSIKPVFMMSPLSIANYLPPGSLDFDLVIFDEASQVKPVDALGAIARGKQIVVVGDSKQMPPTNFFDSMVASDEANEDEENSDTADIESILGLFCAKGAQQRMLRWHYRSRHESLITVSNHLFYDDQLVVFPSPTRERTHMGLVYHRLEQAHYDRGRTRTNPEEAKAVAEAVMVHARNQLRLPREGRDTLGIVAFSQAQMNAIQDHLEYLRRRDSSCEEFFAHLSHEPFFVKNLESVQGDERDVIFISIGYGRTAEGYLGMNFSTLNFSGGERRLNVLISRARKRCEVFTNLTGDDIDVSKTSSAGVAALKTFLTYAQTGRLDVPVKTGRLPDSDFEEQVLRRLSALGHDVHPQVGSAGFFLDLAVVDPDQPGRYLLGIECDGAAYHSARWARDRDRLRQAVLENLGWRMHRIWSTDWFQNPEQELRKVEQAIANARTAGPTLLQSPPSTPPQHQIPSAPAVKAQPTETRRPASPVTPYSSAEIHIRLNGVDMHLIDRSQLADLLAQVVNVESPVHRTDAARRILSGAGVQRFGARIQQAFDEAVAVGTSRSLFTVRDQFLWSHDMQQPPVRDRSQLSTAFRKFELIAPEEIRRAVLVVVHESYGIAPSEVPAAVCRLLGFGRVTEEMSDAVEKHRDELLRDCSLVRQGINLVAAFGS